MVIFGKLVWEWELKKYIIISNGLVIEVYCYKIIVWLDFWCDWKR